MTREQRIWDILDSMELLEMLNELVVAAENGDHFYVDCATDYICNRFHE